MKTFINQLITLLAFVALQLSGCSTKKATDVTIEMADETTVVKPSTVAEAVKVLDLMTFPTMTGPNESITRRVNSLSYSLKAEFDFKAILEFQREAFTNRMWTELPGSILGDEYANCTFTRDGFFASARVQRGKGFWWGVSIRLHGNVDVRKLAFPDDFKPQQIQIRPQWTIYVTDVSVLKTSEECRKRLIGQGWQPYGVVGIDPTVSNVLFFKNNAILLVAEIAPSWAQDQKGKTRVSIHTQLLPVDIPVPMETMRLRYYDPPIPVVGSQLANLYFESKQSPDEVIAFYLAALGSSGWRATGERPVKIDSNDVMIFRNSANDMLTLRMSSNQSDQVLRVTMNHQTNAEVVTTSETSDNKSLDRSGRSGRN
ncbi:MAG: hypothetical protein ACKVT0_03120 [Planctomycetaceae bacterium]